MMERSRALLDHLSPPCYPFRPMDARTTRAWAGFAAVTLTCAVVWGVAEAALASRAAGTGEDAAALAGGLSPQPGEAALVPAPLVGLGTALDAAAVLPGPPPAPADVAGRYAAIRLHGEGDPEDAWLPDRFSQNGGAALLPPDSARVGARLLDRIATATVELVPAEGAPIPCGPFRGSRFSCGDAGWMQVGRAVARVGGRTTSCIWAHPQEGRAVRLRFPGVPLGAAIGGTAALVDGTGTGADVTVSVRVGDAAGTVRIPGKAGGPVPIAVPTPGAAGLGEVELTVAAPNARWRQVCLDPVVLSAPVSVEEAP